MRSGPLPIAITRAEAHAMFAAAKCPRDRRLCELCWHTGARVSEVIRARVGDLTDTGIRLVNLKQGYWRKLPDGGRVHVRLEDEKHVLLQREYLRALQREIAGLPEDAPLVGRHDGLPMTRRRAEQIVTECATDAGVFKRRHLDGDLRPASIHMFRHGHAVNLLLQGVPITGVGRQLGHSSLQSTQVYGQLADPQMHELIAGIRY